ncbi:MAG: ComF family protein [Bacteroidia bacterium]|nr:ComF family protein [Bacteroidia bacterium]NNM23212.1 ComF family protein [Flavobacteriaceae bacterium]
MLNILFPRVCNGCGDSLLKSEPIICAQCRHNLPLACHHRTKSDAMKRIFYGRFPLEQATALLQFQKKGITQQLLHNLKYRGQKKVSSFFGEWLGGELALLPEYQTIDAVIPVPLHKQKLRKRGFNQVHGFASEIARSLDVQLLDDVLLKISKTSSQVFKKRFTRFNQEEVFSVRSPEKIDGMHILLVDDIVTTGATLERCAEQLLRSERVTLSVATIAIA